MLKYSQNSTVNCHGSSERHLSLHRPGQIIVWKCCLYLPLKFPNTFAIILKQASHSVFSKQPAIFSFCFTCCLTCATRIVMKHCVVQFLLIFKVVLEVIFSISKYESKPSMVFVCFKCNQLQRRILHTAWVQCSLLLSNKYWNPVLWSKKQTLAYIHRTRGPINWNIERICFFLLRKCCPECLCPVYIFWGESKWHKYLIYI